MKFILNETREFSNPTEAVVKAGLRSLKPDSVAVLENGHWYVNCYCDDENTFAFQYQDGISFELFEPIVGALSFEQTVDLFTNFLKGDESWKK